MRSIERDEAKEQRRFDRLVEMAETIRRNRRGASLAHRDKHPEFYDYTIPEHETEGDMTMERVGLELFQYGMEAAEWPHLQQQQKDKKAYD